MASALSVEKAEPGKIGEKVRKTWFNTHRPVLLDDFISVVAEPGEGHRALGAGADEEDEPLLAVKIAGALATPCAAGQQGIEARLNKHEVD